MSVGASSSESTVGGKDGRGRVEMYAVRPVGILHSISSDCGWVKVEKV